ncbi:MAG: alanine dehydrogenase [Planctomycetota bacterium]
MKIGVPREIKEDEYRVALIPSGVKRLANSGHTVYVERGAGLGSGISDEEYEDAGAKIVNTAYEVFKNSEIIVKVKEPQSQEVSLITSEHIVICYLHLAASVDLTVALLKTQAVFIAYETIERNDSSLPCLIPMSEIAGKMSVQEGAKYLEKPTQGRGLLLGGVPGVEPANVVILGGGVVGTNAAKVAAGLGANVTILDINLDRLRYLADIMPANVTTLYSDYYNIRRKLRDADILIGAVLISGAKAPRLVTRDDLKLMKQGAIIVDVSIDQGGCVETSRPTTHSKPIYSVDGIIHYAVTNIPGAVSRTSTFALCNATFPYIYEVAQKGWKRASLENKSLARGLNIVKGEITHRHVADSLNLKYTPVEDFLKS